MKFVTGYPILTNEKSNSYNLILVIIDKLTKMIHYTLIIVTIDILGLVKEIIYMVIYQYRVSKIIILDENLLFRTKF